MANLPKRVAELERQVAELNGKRSMAAAKPTVAPGRECPICGSSMKVLSELPHPQFGFGGMKIHEMECPECGHKTFRDFQPGKGYR